MNSKKEVQHVYLVGAKSLGAYGGYETFVYKLTEYHQNKENIKYHVACKANGDGCMDESKFEGVTKINDHEFEFHNARCFKINVPQIGPAQAIYYDVAALKACCEHIKKNHIPHPIVYIMACRIGPFAGHFYREIHKLGGTVFLNPDGHEWMRAKWSAPIRKYWKISEQMMVKYCDLAICDSVNPGDCDGQSGYGVSKLDSIVEEVVRQIFAQFREVSRKKLLESVKTNDAARIQKKIKKIQKDLEAKQKELDDLKAETILVIRGVSALDKELLGTLVAEAREALETLEKQLVQAQEEYEEATKTAKRSNYICNELFTWADVYDTANHDERRAILQQFIKEIRVRKDYEISITLNASFNQVEQLKAVSTYDGAEIFEEISEKGA